MTATRSQDRTRNELRPHTLNDVVGQAAAKRLMRRAVESCAERTQPMDHTLFVAPSGTGKTTLANAVANELGVQVFMIEAPVSADTLLELRLAMNHGDILFLDEIHQQAIMERRGRQASTRPEVLFSIMEDRTMPTQHGVLPWPYITVMGATTDEGMLPDAFVNRFPLRPRLTRYSRDEMGQIARMNARSLQLALTPEAERIFSTASRGIPREVNNLMKNAAVLLKPGQPVTADAALDVLSLNGITHDGLTSDMQAMLTFLVTRARRETKDGAIYQASVGTIATAIGKSRDAKAVALRVEPYLIERGYVQVTHGGRRLTDAGVDRAQQLARFRSEAMA